jgi:DNA-binding transcriptional LysR family regulator
MHLGFLRLPVSGPPGVVFRPLLEEEMLLVLPTGHPLLQGWRGDGMPAVSLASLKDERFILVRRHGAPGMYSNLIDACKRAGFTPQIAVEVDRMLTNISLVAAGMGISAVPASMRGFHAESVVYCRIRDGGAGLAAPLTLVTREDEIMPAVRHFLDMVEQVLAPASR